MMMAARARARAQRAALSRSSAQEIAWPLPYRGLLDVAKDAHISGLYAARFTNLWTDGVRITTRPGFRYADSNDRPADRIPFEFGATPHHLMVYPTELVGRTGSLTRASSAPFMAAQLSSRLILVDGGGAPLVYDGTAPASAGFTTENGAGGAAPEQPADMIGVIAHQDRVYLWPRNRLGFYYGKTVGAITGPLVEFPLDRLGNITGQVAIMASWTVDSARSTDDVLVIVTTTGDVALYRGDDPGDADRFAIIGRYKIARPVGRLTSTEVGGDLLILTVKGLVSMRDVFGRGSQALAVALTEPVSDDLAALVATAATPDRWRVATDPGQRYSVVSIVEPAFVRHLVFGWEARGWATWEGVPAQSWSTLGGEMRFTGLDGREGVMGRPGEDHYGDDDGDPIAWAYRSSWVAFRRNGAFVSLEPSILGRAPMALDVAVLADQRETIADVAAATQRVSVAAQGAGSAAQSLEQVIPIGRAGRVFQVRLEGSTAYAQLVRLSARIGA